MHTHCWRAEVCICNHAPGSGGVAFQRPTSLRRQMTIQPISKPWAEPLLGLLFFSSELLISMVTTLCATNYAPGNGNSPPAFLVWDVLNWYRTYFRSNKQKWNCLISSSSCTWNLWWAYNMLVLCLEWTSPFPHIMTLCNIPRQHWVYKQPQQSTPRRRPPTQGCWAQRLYWPQVARLMWIVDMCSMKLSLRRGRVEPENIAYLLMSWRPTEPIREPFVLFTTSSALCYQQRRKIESWLCLLVLLDMWMTHDVNFWEFQPPCELEIVVPVSEESGSMSLDPILIEKALAKKNAKYDWIVKKSCNLTPVLCHSNSMTEIVAIRTSVRQLLDDGQSPANKGCSVWDARGHVWEHQP